MSRIQAIRKTNLKNYIGQYIYVRQKDGSIVKGKLVAIDNERAYIKPIRKNKGKRVESNWIIGLFLAGIVFVGLAAFWGGAWGAGFGGRCFKRCCGIPCNRGCNCRHRRHGRHGYRHGRYGRGRGRAVYV